jgi:hypothetical protein
MVSRFPTEELDGSQKLAVLYQEAIR